MTIYKYPRKELLFLLSSLLAFFFLSSCQKQPNLLFGNGNTDDNNSANVVVVDSATVQMTTTFVDSTSTSGTGYLMVGNYKDPYLGKVTSRAYWQVSPPSTLPTISAVNNTYDSMSLILFYKKKNPWYGDTTALQSYVVNQVDTLYQLGNFQYGWYSHNSLRLNPTPLGSTGPMFIYPTKLDSFPLTSQGPFDTVKIKLDDNLGRRLYNMVYTLSDSVKNNTIWLNWFHGLCLSPGTSNDAAIYGFKDSAIMRIFYREAGPISTVKYIDFNITNRSYQFNNVRSDYTGTALQNIKKPTQTVQPPPETPSALTGNASYIQTITGLNVKLTFPYLNKIALRPDYIGLLRAQLTVRPVPGSFNTTWTLPPQLGVYTTDQNNLLGTPIPAAGVSGLQTGNLVLNYFNPLSVAYTYDVTAFIKQQITNNASNAAQTGLYLSVPSPASDAAFNRLVIADQSYPVNQRITLSVYYISLFPHQ
ncbi:MAG: DUF4270 family protein [Bacteroidetes bacterium]|nr:DUF4270 family protein [Bacteroidota bacterium]